MVVVGSNKAIFWWVLGSVTSHGNKLLRWCVTSLPGESLSVRIASRGDRYVDSSSWPYAHSGIILSCLLIEVSRKEVFCSAVEAQHCSYSNRCKKSQIYRSVKMPLDNKPRYSCQIFFCHLSYGEYLPFMFLIGYDILNTRQICPIPQLKCIPWKHLLFFMLNPLEIT